MITFLGISVYSKQMSHRAQLLMHHKFIIIDESELLVASMNSTKNAISGNFENIILTNDESAVGPFLQHFQQLIYRFSKN